jgi:hypothetical protein
MYFWVMHGPKLLAFCRSNRSSKPDWDATNEVAVAFFSTGGKISHTPTVGGHSHIYGSVKANIRPFEESKGLDAASTREITASKESRIL